VALLHSVLSKLRFLTAHATRTVMPLYWRLTRGLTLGVRGLVIDGQGRVFLVKHTYVHGWHLPGGGVEPGETVLDALARELKEEGNIELVGAPEQLSVYFHAAISQRDHVVLFVVRHFRQPAPPVPDYEIMAHGFFQRDALSARHERCHASADRRGVDGRSGVAALVRGAIGALRRRPREDGADRRAGCTGARN
jgi:ADP-ribose pyrophosphatase YjhB (NUDIX family)